MVFRETFKPLFKGRKVLVLEDVITTGASVLKIVEAVEDLGGQVVGVVAVWNRSGKKWLLSRAYRSAFAIHSLIDMPLPSWEAEDCPLCADGVEITGAK